MFKTNTYTYTNANANANTASATDYAAADNNVTMSPSYLGYLDNLVRTSEVILLNADFAQKGAGFEAFIRSLIPILDKYKRKIMCPQATSAELRYLCTSPDVGVSKRATAAREGIAALYHAGYIVYSGDPNIRETADAAAVKFVFTNIWDKNILVLTQSREVFEDCRLFERIRSTKLNHTVTVKRITDMNGRIGDFSENRDPVSAKSEQRQTVTANANANTAEILKRFGL